MSDFTIFFLSCLGLVGLGMILSTITKCVELIVATDDDWYCPHCEPDDADA